MTKKECVACSQALDDSEVRHPVENGEGFLCQSCYRREREEPAATFIHSDGKREWVSSHLSSYGLRGREAPAKLNWTSVDPWRGYYSLEPADGWKVLHSDALLSHSRDAADLKEFDKRLTEQLEEMGIEYVKAFTKTSNVFSTGYDLLVPEGRVNEAKAVSIILAWKYRDPKRFKATALTGKDPEELSQRDELFLDLVEKLDQGEKAKELVKEFSP